MWHGEEIVGHVVGTIVDVPVKDMRRVVWQESGKNKVHVWCMQLKAQQATDRRPGRLTDTAIANMLSPRNLLVEKAFHFGGPFGQTNVMGPPHFVRTSRTFIHDGLVRNVNGTNVLFRYLDEIVHVLL
jgi:hypothetical protein